MPTAPLRPIVTWNKHGAENESLVVVDCSSFGKEGPWRDYNAPELVAAALAGQSCDDW